jgi:primase-polymerase (primpol)-like protein
MSSNYESIIKSRAKQHGVDVNQMIDLLRDQTDVKVVCLDVIRSKNLDLNYQNMSNCIEKMKYLNRIHASIRDKIY